MTVALRSDEEEAVLRRAADAVLDRVAAWASRLTRFDRTSELCRLNDGGDRASIGPTLTAVLDWARIAEDRSDGLVDVSMLDARIAAEHGAAEHWASIDPRTPGARRRWSLSRTARGAMVRREPGVRFDLDGVAKGWLADRALAIVAGPGRSALVDADGDIAARVAAGDTWDIGVGDPRTPDGLLAVLRLPGGETGRTLGVATSGTTVHRWAHGAGASHHLIHPRTRRPADTDVTQATVLAATAREAEAFAKVGVVAGADDAFARLDRPGVLGVLLLTDRGEIRATPEMTRWLA
ncbi:MAG TPA: FAD:protein FMN transferase [Candidatus Limnocylindrales bacterium]